jgi:lysozyme family protein
MNFDVAFERLLGSEGALSLVPSDPGNWTGGMVGVGALHGTKYGISAASYPTEDIANITKEHAKFLYKRDFWNRIHADELYDGVAFQTFDFAVNSGINTAVRYLQRAVGVADDGVWGPISKKAAFNAGETDTLLRLNGLRLDYMTRLSTWPTFGKGWARRIAKNLLYAADDS